MQALNTLNEHLSSRTYIVRAGAPHGPSGGRHLAAQVGEAVTLADVVLVCALLYPMKLVFDADFRCARAESAAPAAAGSHARATAARRIRTWCAGSTRW